MSDIIQRAKAEKRETLIPHDERKAILIAVLSGEVTVWSLSKALGKTAHANAISYSLLKTARELYQDGKLKIL